ncbi:MAG: acyl-CoA desaturase [Planctomycetes bacterium]|nr:acyl-CoA desaturase [Planctomycetota bacterium]
MTSVRRFFGNFRRRCIAAIDSHDGRAELVTQAEPVTDEQIAAAATAKLASDRIDWVRCIPFFLLHLACFAVVFVGWSWPALIVAFALYVVRMHAITGWYHRYFSHRTFKTNRFWQFFWASVGNSSAQRGPLWWAAHHRHHHRYSDEPEDIHSPKQRGFWWSHMAWFLTKTNYRSNMEVVPDLAKYPELVWLDRFDCVMPTILGFACFGLGMALQHWGYQTSGAQMLVWGFVISTVFTAHATFTINSLSHVFGTRRYETSDTSKNNFLLALLTLGEGWHNNHHHYQSTARQGFRWYEIDVSYYLLVVQSWLRMVRDLKPVPEHVVKGLTLAESKAAGPAAPELAEAARTAQPSSFLLKSREPAA